MEGEVMDVKRMMEEIEIKSLTGKRIAVEVGVSDTLRDLKQKVFASEEIDPGNQRFMFGGKCLIDDEVAVVDQMNAILAKRSSPLPRLTVWLLFKLKGGEDDGESLDRSPSTSSSEADLDGEQKEAFEVNGRRLQIHVISLTADEIPVVITPTDTLRDLNQKIKDIQNIPPNQQMLIFGGSLLSDGIVFDQVNAILARLPRLVDSIETHDSMPETVHVKMSLMLRLRGGLNVIHHEGQRTWTASDSDSDHDENRRNGRARNTASHEVHQGHRNSPPNASKGARSGKKKKGKAGGWFSCFIRSK
ncbi:hypothetical protein Scep_023232 [Stephania cephalantha]|uniref:Ubiquitin-like domain-containing protein n=1 Tax=Stephania cephalantha TaxID=152367 RepID=A0AAP0EX68_9MAGN